MLNKDFGVLWGRWRQLRHTWQSSYLTPGFVLFFFFWWWHSGVTPGNSGIIHLSEEDHMGSWGFNLGWSFARQVLYPTIQLVHVIFISSRMWHRAFHLVSKFSISTMSQGLWQLENVSSRSIFKNLDFFHKLLHIACYLDIYQFDINRAGKI